MTDDANDTPQPLATPRQREIFEALLEDFLAHGFAHFTMDGAAHRLHCSKSTLYSLGHTGDDVIRRVLVSFFREVTRRTDHALTSQRSPSAALQAYFEAMATAMEPATPVFMRDVISTPVGRRTHETNTRAATQKITALMEAGIMAGEFRPLDVTVTAHLVEVMLEHIQQGGVTSTTPSDAYTELGRLVLGGITVGR
ncbi:TetR family transcriptional regulator [Luteococcus japonicus]|uniref:TetR family transcriptional regulator n=1 Tax=Luteococcus japonicus TaxID=33984 RepID=A0A3N1ZSW5_9ACTN|nr:TetR/AcrR family transcriptional regulator [Luteococcus japonicus]ROR53960.1 TetR family transcriptional regulator [Luteococcus japonicus]